MPIRSLIALVALLLAAPAAAQAPHQVLLASITTATTSAEQYVAQWPNAAVQVVVESGTCTGLSLVLEGRVAGTTWAPIGSAITHSDVPVTESRAWAIPAGFFYVRARAATVTSCTVSVYLARNP